MELILNVLAVVGFFTLLFLFIEWLGTGVDEA